MADANYTITVTRGENRSTVTIRGKVDGIEVDKTYDDMYGSDPYAVAAQALKKLRDDE